MPRARPEVGKKLPDLEVFSCRAAAFNMLPPACLASANFICSKQFSCTGRGVGGLKSVLLAGGGGSSKYLKLRTYRRLHPETVETDPSSPFPNYQAVEVILSP